MTKKYNGWTNYESWLVGLWLDNDEGSYTYWRDRAKQVSKRELAKELKASHEDWVSENVTGVFADLLNSALKSVNWEEVAKHVSND
jgi:hypothetical protein